MDISKTNQILKATKNQLRLLLILPFLITPLMARPPHGFYLRMMTGYAFALESTWQDTKGSANMGVPVYGDGYFAAGSLGNSPAVDLALGYELTPTIALEFGGGTLPGLNFKGQVNYPEAGEHQPVSSRLQAAFINLGARIRLPGQGGGQSWLNPSIRLAAGFSVNHTDGVEMSFPDLVTPHTFMTPPGRMTSFYYELSVGNTIPIGSRLSLEIELLLQSPGRIETDSGVADIIRSDRTIPIMVNETEAWIKTVGLYIGLCYHFHRQANQ